MADADASILGCCGICLYSALNPWCITRPFGANVSCCGPRGCCGSCCDSSFNEDDFDERMKKEQAKNGTSDEPVASQPEPSHAMSTAAGDPKPVNESEVV